MPFEVDTFYNQYYLREASHFRYSNMSTSSRQNVYLLGGNFIHKVNFKKRTWETRCKGNYEFGGD
jgi:hypothetical protein